ncbi:MAG: glutathione synthase [Candidatus Dadabacteria bacterium]|nr:MAG: glutathione synthase [Candidatus Dadabacteria bacterium]
MKLKMAFVMDPIGTINTEKDTTFVLMLEAQARGHEVWYLELKDMFVKEAQAFGNATQISLERSEDFYKLGDTQTLPLESFDAVWMRKDPPVNNDFLYATYILSLIDENKTKVLNNPTGIRESNEKLYSLFFPEIIPQSIVTKNIGQLEEFLSEAGGQIVVKPLDGHGGEGIFYVREGDRNANVILESITKFGTEYVIGQKFIEKVSEGDKRIIILNGEPLGAVLRVPKPGGEFRSNFHSGGSPAKSELTQRDLEICEAIGPRLRKDGLYLVGLDVIGGYVTEINTTSPTGVQEINNLDGVKLETQIIEFAEELCGS